MTDMYFNAITTYHVTYALCWFIMLIQVIQFLIIYLKRLIVTMFLITIFPLVAVSYAIDKIADGKSQALNNWMKEFMLNVFVQSFHVVNYVILMGLVQELSNSNFILTILAITYISRGGDMIRSLFAQMTGGNDSASNKFLDATKSYLGMKVAIDATKRIGQIGSSLAGKNSLLGKGISKIGKGRMSHLQARAINENAKASEFMREHNLYPEYNEDGSRIVEKGRAKKDVARLLGHTNSTDREYAMSANRLSEMSNADLQSLISEMGLSPEDINSLEGLLVHATAFSAITNRHANNNKVNIQQSVELIVHDRETGDSRIDKLSRGMGYSNERLRKIAASESITLDKDKAAERRASETPTTNIREQVRRAANSIKNASEGTHSISELYKNIAILNGVKKGMHTSEVDNEELIQIMNDELQDMNYSLEEFEVNLAVEALNNLDTISDEGERAELRDTAIGTIKKAKKKKHSDTILENLRANPNNLEEGVDPTLISENKHRKSIIQRDIVRELAENPYAYDRGEEYDELRRNYEDELQSYGTENIISGAIETVGGAISSTKRIARGTAGALASIGMASGGDKNTVEELIVASTVGFDLGQKPTEIATKGVSKVAEKISKKTREPDFDLDFREEESIFIDTEVRRRGNIRETVITERAERVRRRL